MSRDLSTLCSLKSSGNKWKYHEGGCRDGFKYQKGTNKGHYIKDNN